jgi:hypothetical protein
MLIDKGIGNGEVVTFKLNSGEEVVAKLVSESEQGYRISRPMVLSMTSQGIGMMPFMFTVSPEKEITINRHAVTVISTAEKQFADQYLQGTTGIKLV